MLIRIDRRNHSAVANDRNAIAPHKPGRHVDYHVGDIVLCIASQQGLQEGRAYPVDAVSHRRVIKQVETIVTLLVDDMPVQIHAPMSILRRTKLNAQHRQPDGRCQHNRFDDAADLNDYCKRNRIPRNEFCQLEYEEILVDEEFDYSKR